MKLYCIPVWEVDKYIGRSEYEFVDVRTREEFAGGHLLGAVNIPFMEVEDWGEMDFGEMVPIFYCSRGSTSLRAAAAVVKAGREAANISHGIQYYQGRNWLRIH